MTSFDPITGQTVFKFRVRRAEKVYLIGSFGGSKPSIIPMRKERGHWVVKLRLPAGTYRYRFNVDGILSKRGVAEVEIDYRRLSHKLLLEVSAGYTCLHHPHKWN